MICLLMCSLILLSSCRISLVVVIMMLVGRCLFDVSWMLLGVKCLM